MDNRVSKYCTRARSLSTSEAWDLRFSSSCKRFIRQRRADSVFRCRFKSNSAISCTGSKDRIFRFRPALDLGLTEIDDVGDDGVEDKKEDEADNVLLDDDEDDDKVGDNKTGVWGVILFILVSDVVVSIALANEGREDVIGACDWKWASNESTDSDTFDMEERELMNDKSSAEDWTPNREL